MTDNFGSVESLTGPVSRTNPVADNTALDIDPVSRCLTVNAAGNLVTVFDNDETPVTVA